MGVPRDSNAAGVEAVALRKMAKRGRAWLLENLCAPQLSEQKPEGLLRELLRERLALYAQIEDPDFRLKAFKTDHWSFRWTTTSLRMFQSAAFPRLPFYDTRLTDLCGTLPTDFVRGRRLQLDALRTFAPDLAGIRWEATGSSLNPTFVDPALVLLRRAWNKAGRTLRRERPIQRNWEVQFLREEGRRAVSETLLSPKCRLHSYVSPGRIVELLQGFDASPSAENGYAVSALVTFALWLERHG
jgi:asparagine synthase (glutamine-hydrolysing)